VFTGHALDIRRDRKVWRQVRRELEARMIAGRTTVVDATNIDPAGRARHMAVARAHGRPVVAIRFDVPAAELVERNESRDRAVRPEVVVTMAVDMDRQADAATLAAESIDVVLDADEVRRLLL
jgi:predicted kinase